MAWQDVTLLHVELNQRRGRLPTAKLHQRQLRGASSHVSGSAKMKAVIRLDVLVAKCLMYTSKTVVCKEVGGQSAVKENSQGHFGSWEKNCEIKPA